MDKTKQTVAGNGRRRTWWVDAKFQGALLGLQAAVWVLTLGAIWVQVDRSLRQMWARGVSVGFPADHVYFAFAREQRAFFTTAFLIGALVSLGVGLTLTLWMSHRMAGPVARFRAYLAYLAKNAETTESFDELKFRETDFMADLPKHLNVFLKRRRLLNTEKRSA